MCVATWKLALLLYMVFNTGATICWIAFMRMGDRSWPRRGERMQALLDAVVALIGFPFEVLWDFCLVPLWMRARRKSRPPREIDGNLQTAAAAPIASYSTVIPIGDADDVRKKKRRRKRHRRW